MSQQDFQKVKAVLLKYMKAFIDFSLEQKI